MSHLHELQLRFQNYLVGDSEDIEWDIASSDGALAEHRLGVYYNAYRIRLIDCLAIDYPALEKHLGREAFENLTLDYLKHYPSTHPSVRWFGANLPQYLQRFYPADEREFLQELASYEWARTLVFDAADSATLAQLEDVARIPAEAWPGLKFDFVAALRWLDLYWNVTVIKNAVDKGDTMPANQRAEHPLRWLVWRQEMKTHWRSLDVHEAWAIEIAANGASFAEICEGLLEWVDEQQVAITAAGFFKQWVSDQLLEPIRQP